MVERDGRMVEGDEGGLEMGYLQPSPEGIVRGEGDFPPYDRLMDAVHRLYDGGWGKGRDLC